MLHPITPPEEYRRPDAAALAAEGLEAKFAVINLKTKQYKVTKVRRAGGAWGQGWIVRVVVCCVLCVGVHARSPMSDVYVSIHPPLPLKQKKTQDDLVVSDKIEGLEPGQIHEVEEVRCHCHCPCHTLAWVL